MKHFRNLLRMTVSQVLNSGLGDIVVNQAASGFVGFEASDDGLEFDITIAEGSSREVCSTVYTHSSRTLSRGALLRSTAAGNARVVFTPNATVDVVISAETMNSLMELLEGVPPGPVTSLQAGTATSSTQPLTWVASATGTAPITYQVAYRLGSSTGAYTNFGSPVSGTSATVTGLSASTAYDYQVTPINAAGSGTPATLADVSTAAAAPDSRARFGYGTATAGVSDPATLLASMTVMTGSSNGSKVGSFTSTVPTGQYGWAAFEATASASGVTFTDPLGTGGWQGASSSGNNTTDPGESPNTSTVTAVIGGVTWRFFRQNYASASGQFTTS